MNPTTPTTTTADRDHHASSGDMPLPLHPSTRPINLQPACQHLRHKMMYVDPRQATPGYVDDGSDTRVFLCARTQEVLGPDDGPVGPDVCGTGRGCCERPHAIVA